MDKRIDGSQAKARQYIVNLGSLLEHVGHFGHATVFVDSGSALDADPDFALLFGHWLLAIAVGIHFGDQVRTRATIGDKGRRVVEDQLGQTGQQERFLFVCTDTRQTQTE